MPIRARTPADLAGCVALLRTVHETSGYPSRWPADPARWLTPASLIAAWVAEADGLITGHIALVAGMRAECLLQATGRDPAELGGISRLFVGPAARRQGTALALLEAATARAADRGLQPVLDVVNDGHAAIALYERAGWKQAGTEPAAWTNADGNHPTVRYYVAP
jgi:GNAT superfamily N-acetyltransferase